MSRSEFHPTTGVVSRQLITLRDRLTCPAKFVPYVYILKNSSNKFYTGITALTPEERLIRHNKGDVISTKNGKPWALIYFEEFDTLQEAREKEKLVKGWKGGNAFKKFLSKPAGSSNGRMQLSESCHLGSNPSPAGLERNKEKFGGVK